MSKRIRLSVPEGMTKVLLHSCCAPCSTAILESMLEQGLKPTLYYYNPNTFPREEYDHRKEEIVRLSRALDIPFAEGTYDHEDWVLKTGNYKDEPEGGNRCLTCFKIRLAGTARYAHENRFSLFTTTLASSRWKNLKQVTEAGKMAAELFPGLVFWEQNWRKYGLSERKVELNKTFDFYQQQYCGCEYSLRDTNNWRKSQGKSPIESH